MRGGQFAHLFRSGGFHQLGIALVVVPPMAATLTERFLAAIPTTKGFFGEGSRSIGIGEEDVELILVVPDARTLSFLALVVLFDDSRSLTHG